MIHLINCPSGGFYLHLTARQSLDRIVFWMRFDGERMNTAIETKGDAGQQKDRKI